jgi:2-polyprenyl-6-methoxyphenol hydroxylase-like FAD-dependent oxidoreductase
MAEASDHAVVIGAGIAGLLAARALEGRFGQVTVVDRDALPDQPVPRVGVPQARHTHRTLGRGRRALEELFPGLTDALVARGAVPGRLGVSRPLLEWYVRQRLTSSPQVRFLERTAALDLRWDPAGGRVVGVRAVNCDDPSTTPLATTIEADLVVDASGRASRLTEWLHRAGHAEPRQQLVRVDLTYVTRQFRWSSVDLGCPPQLVVTPRPGIAGAATAMRQENGVWTVSVAGYHGNRPPLELERFLAAASLYGGSHLAGMLNHAEPLDDGTSYRFPANRRWHYEGTAVPPGVLAVGDAVCTLDPLLGHGMTLSALEALNLGAHGLGRPAAAFFRRTARLLAGPWSVAVQQARRTEPGPSWSAATGSD